MKKIAANGLKIKESDTVHPLLLFCLFVVVFSGRKYNKVLENVYYQKNIFVSNAVNAIDCQC